MGVSDWVVFVSGPVTRKLWYRAPAPSARQHVLAGLEIELLAGGAGQVRNRQVHEHQERPVVACRQGELVPGGLAAIAPVRAPAPAEWSRARTRPVLAPLKVRSRSAGALSAKLRRTRVPGSGRLDRPVAVDRHLGEQGLDLLGIALEEGMGDVGDLAEAGLPVGGLHLIERGGENLAGRRPVVVVGLAAVTQADHQPPSLVNVAVEQAPGFLVEGRDVEQEDRRRNS